MYINDSRSQPSLNDWNLFWSFDLAIRANFLTMVFSLSVRTKIERFPRNLKFLSVRLFISSPSLSKCVRLWSGLQDRFEKRSWKHINLANHVTNQTPIETILEGSYAISLSICYAILLVLACFFFLPKTNLNT